MGKLKLSNLRLLLALVVVIVLGVVLAPLIPKLYRFGHAATTTEHTERNALEVLKSEQLTFLVTDRITSQIVVESADFNMILGKKEGYLIAKAKLYYGIDLAKLTEADLVRTDTRLTVRLPQPEELDFAIDLDSMRFISKRSGLMVIADWITGSDQQDALRRQFKTAALAYMTNEKLIPSKEAIILRLAGLGDMFSEYLGIDVVFE